MEYMKVKKVTSKRRVSKAQKRFIIVVLHSIQQLSQIIMSQESNKEDIAAPKLLIDRPSDFRFHAAYIAYSEVWDKTASQETKNKLNEIIESLSKNEIDYQNFYEKINQYRMNFRPERTRSRTYIETQRKREWRRKTAKSARDARHRR